MWEECVNARAFSTLSTFFNDIVDPENWITTATSWPRDDVVKMIILSFHHL